MSILKKPYEISVWDDVWQSDKFVEKRLGIIGTDTMTSLNRALEPNLIRNVNGVKKFSFKMYKHYTDPITGEKVTNPYVDWLVSERKVKLKYGTYIDSDGQEKDCWYDFIVKSVSENSTNYLYTYQLEDALVQELSKNGFGVTLDVNLNNNMGSADYLARTVLEETDWEVPTECEKLVQTVPEALIYLNVKEGVFKATRLIDQTKQELTKGINDGDKIEIAKGKTILAFYSSCTNKPYRFQFIYLDGADVETDVERNIINKNCQYYSDNLTYIEDKENGYWLPDGLEVLNIEEDGVKSVLSTKYRGKRYGFAQQAVYLPVLERYVNVFDKNGEVYYGYEHAEYVSPALTQNLISNSTFESTSGWTGTKVNEDGSKPKIEAVYGRFENKQFISVVEDIRNGKFSSANSYKTYLQIEWPEDGKNAILLNSCIYDNRILLGNITTNEEFALKISCVNNEGGPYNNYNCVIENYTYSPEKDKYSKDNNIIFSSVGTNSGYNIYKVTSSNYTEKTFKKSNIRLGIIFNSAGTYYIDGAELFKAYYVNNELIMPEEQAESLEDRAVNKSYYFFSATHANSLKNKEDFKAEEVCTTIDYATYKPVFDIGAEKIRSVTAKESNYFNILQSIAETFEAWLELKIERNDDGSIDKKIVQFKNYVGQDNYAGFRYGVNLKDIQRTYESKNIVTKLMVKQNSNEYGENGFCTIARAGANPTGEAYIYDFQYYQNKGLMSASEYLKSNYVLDGAIGEDAELWKSNAITKKGTNINLQGYFPRLKAINNILKKETDLLLNAAKDLTQYEAEYEIADAGYLAAKSGIEEVREKFELLTNQSIDNLSGIDTERTDVAKLLREYAEYFIKERQYSKERLSLRTENHNDESTWGKLDKAENEYKEIQERIDKYKGWKSKLNKLFFSKYSRFIQEGTWINEEYMDDDKYYADSLSVLYNSCYPQVAYSINVLELSKLPGYELFKVGLGDKTYAEDPEFFGTDLREEVIVSELSENLDDPSKNLVKVQNFKNQFQDLFQKITATVQQTQYNEGSYKKGAALAEANQERKQQFLSDALDSASARLTAAGQQSVTWGNDGITVKSVNSPSDMVRMVGGAIMLSKQDKNGQQKWVTGITSDGVSADLINAGTVNTNNINIMNADEPVFKWDSYGISAFDSVQFESEIGTTISAIDTKKFVRFDKHGIYGINNAGIDGEKWKPGSIDDIDAKATFALTWEGLKVTGNGGIASIGRSVDEEENDYIMVVKNDKEQDTFRIKSNGDVEVGGEFYVGDLKGNTITKVIENAKGEAITDAVKQAKDYADETITTKIGEIEIGGRNLLLNTGTGIGWPSGCHVQGSEFKFTCPERHNEKYYILDQKFTLEKNTNYVLSFKCKKPSIENGDKEQAAGPFEIWICHSGAIYESTKIIKFQDSPTSTDYTKFEGTFTTGEDVTDCKIRFDCNANTEKTLSAWYAKDIKLEKGTKATDWTAAPEDLDNTIDAIQTQVDKKAEIFYCNDDPKPNDGSWDNDEAIGNMWRDTGDNKEYVWQKSGEIYGWHEMEIPNNIFDAYDGKATLYTSKPENGYKVNDLWILDKQGLDNNAATYDSTYPKYKVGTLLVAKNSRPDPNDSNDPPKTYVIDDWEEKTRYTDDSALNTFKVEYTETLNNISAQLDQKADTYYDNKDPSDNWKEDEKEHHVGDLWHCIADIIDESTGEVVRRKGSEWIYQYKENEYFWDKLDIDIPDEVFDKIDGKASIYITKPSSYSENDLWFLDQEHPIGIERYEGYTLLHYNGHLNTYEQNNWIDVSNEQAVNLISALYNEPRYFDGESQYISIHHDRDLSQIFYPRIGDLAYILSENNYYMAVCIYNSDETWEEFPEEWSNILLQEFGLDNFDQLWLERPTEILGETLWLLNSDYYEDCWPGKERTYKTGTILVALNSNNEFSYFDWDKLDGYTDETTLQNSLEILQNNLKEQVDKKAELFYGPDDPSENNNWGAEQVGNLWHCTEEIKKGQEVLRRKNSEWIWQKNRGTYEWKEMNIDVPDEVFDKIDGKATIYTNKPEEGYKQNDLWFLEKDYVLGEEYTNTVLLGSDLKEYSPAGWTANENTTLLNALDILYRDRFQLDKYQKPYINYIDCANTSDFEDPYVGDLCFAYEPAYLYVYDGENWVELSTIMSIEESEAIFRLILGKPSIRVWFTKPTDFNQYNYWLLNPLNYETDWPRKTIDKIFKQGTILTAINDGESFDWNNWEKKDSYTDDTVANEAKQEADEAKSAAEEAKSTAEEAKKEVDNKMPWELKDGEWVCQYHQSKEKGFLMWAAAPEIADRNNEDYGNFDEDKNIVFKVGQKLNDNNEKVPYLQMRGNGEFTGKIIAQAGGNIAGWDIAEDRIDKKDTNDNSLVGMHSGDIKRASLVQIKTPITSTEKIQRKFVPTIGQSGTIDVGNSNNATKIVNFVFNKPSNLSSKYCYAEIQEDGSIIIKYFFVRTSNTGNDTLPNDIIQYSIEYEYLTGEMNVVQMPDSPIRFYAGNESELANKEFVVLEDGSLYASAANISGNINAESGEIGGWNISEDSISKNTVKLYSGENIKYPSSMVGDSELRISAGAPPSKQITCSMSGGYQEYVNVGHYTPDNPLVLYLMSEKCEEMEDATYILHKVTGEAARTQIGVGLITYDLIEDGEGYNESWGIVYSNLTYDDNYSKYLVTLGIWVEQYAYDFLQNFSVKVDLVEKYPFMILEDGSLYANAADISGTITANNGTIGGANISENAISLKYGGSLNIGSGILKCDQDEKNVTLQNTKGDVEIGSQSAKLIFPLGTTDITETAEVNIYAAKRGERDYKLAFKPKGGTMPVAATCSIKIDDYYSNLGGKQVLVQTTYYTVSMSQGQTNSTDIYWSIPLQPSYRPTYLGSILTIENTITTSMFKAITEQDNYIHTWSFDYPKAVPAIISCSSIVPQLYNITSTGGNVSTNSGLDLGAAQAPWRNIYASSTSIHSSDKNLKNSIQPLSSIHEKIFDALEPVSYKFNINDSNRTHIGLIAQDVKKAIEDAGLTTQEFAGYCEWENENGSTGCGLRYGEFIALNIYEIQKLKARAQKAEETIQTQKEKIQQLEERLERLEKLL